jgi:hypothetical protein
MAKTAGQMTAYRIYASDQASRITSHLTPERKIQLKRQEARKILRNCLITLGASTVAIPVTGGASGFIAIPAFMHSVCSVINVVASHVDFP